jgi:1-deoxy-D-xylulose-5-phosphate reductoisomerase
MGDRAGGTATAVMSAANEKAVEVFLAGRIGYLDIVPLAEATCNAHVPELNGSPTIDDIVYFDQWARRWADEHAGQPKQTKNLVAV